MKLITVLFFTLCTIICFSVTESSAKDSLSIETVVKQEQPKLHNKKRTGGLLKGIAQCILSVALVPVACITYIYIGTFGSALVFTSLFLPWAVTFNASFLFGSILALGYTIAITTLIPYTLTCGIQNISAYIYETSEPEYESGMVTLTA